MKKLLGGYILDGEAKRHQLDLVENPDDHVIDDYVTQVASERGVLQLTISPEPDLGPIDLTMYAENGRVLHMLAEHHADGDIGVRTIVSDGIGDGLASMLGERYPAQAMTRDAGIARLTFKQFSRGRDVSQLLMK